MMWQGVFGVFGIFGVVVMMKLDDSRLELGRIGGVAVDRLGIEHFLRFRECQRLVGLVAYEDLRALFCETVGVAASSEPREATFAAAMKELEDRFHRFNQALAAHCEAT